MNCNETYREWLKLRDVITDANFPREIIVGWSSENGDIIMVLHNASDPIVFKDFDKLCEHLRDALKSCT
jgi:hypothetical protein